MVTSSNNDVHKIAESDRFAMRQVIIGLLALVLVVFPAQAQENDDSSVYSVSDVAVDVTADSAANARDQAIMQAQHLAFAQLLTRLGADASISERQDDNAIASLVQAFEVQQERSSAVRYIGTFTVQFKPNAVRNLLNKSGKEFSDARSKPMVVLPVTTSAGRSILWEDHNAWRNAWEAIVRNSGLVPVIVPAGELDDIAVISTPEAVSGKPESIEAIAAKYQAGGVVVAILNADPTNPDPKQPIIIDVKRYDSMGKAGETAKIFLPPAADTKALAGILTDGVKKVRAEMEGGWKQSHVAPKGPVMHLPVAVPIASLTMWAEIRSKLANVSSISKVNVIAITRGAASIELEYRGEIFQLQDAMAKQNIVLEQSVDTGGWVLRKNVL